MKKKTPTETVDEYLRALPVEIRSALEGLRRTIRTAAPGAVEAVSYRIPIVKYKNHPLVGFGATKNQCSFYLMSSWMIPRLAKAKITEFKDFDVSGATIHFSPEKPPPEALVQKLVRERIAENEERSRSS